MLIKKYLPQLYDNNEDMLAIANSEEVEFETNLKPAITNSFKDEFVKIATENGIERFEKLFGIIADPETETLNFRRERLFVRLISQLPFTEKYLQQQLNAIIGEGQWSYDLEYNDYTLDIWITVPGRAWLNELYDFLDRTIPCNIDWHGNRIHIYQASWQQVKEGFSTWNDLSSYTWEEIKFAEWM